MYATVANPAFRMPGWVVDLATFRRWATSDEFPDEGHIAHLNGDLLVDMSMETLNHNTVKTRVGSRLDLLSVEEKLGRYQGDRMRLTHPEAGLSTELDGLFMSKSSIQRQAVQLVRGGQSVEIVGSPDMVLEVVSDSSVEKDTVLLPKTYFKAGIKEYWLIDPRHELRFDIFRRGTTGFVAIKPRGGWLRSQVFGHSFRLICDLTDPELPDFVFEMR